MASKSFNRFSDEDVSRVTDLQFEVIMFFWNYAKNKSKLYNKLCLCFGGGGGKKAINYVGLFYRKYLNFTILNNDICTLYKKK